MLDYLYTLRIWFHVESIPVRTGKQQINPKRRPTNNNANHNIIDVLKNIDNGINRIPLKLASGTVEILNVRWLFILWISKEGQVDWWIELQKLHAFKEKDNKQILCWYYIQKKGLLFIKNILMSKISSNIHLFRI